MFHNIFRGEIMDKNIELAEYIYQNSQMGKDCLEQLNPIISDNEMKDIIISQLKEYREIFLEAKKIIEASNSPLKGINKFLKFTSYLSINMKMMFDKSPSHIAELLIQGSTMGVIQITKKLKDYTTCEQNILNLAERLLRIEQRNIDDLKKYL